MQYLAKFFRLGAVGTTCLILVAGLGELTAQTTATGAAPAKSMVPDDLSQAELLRSYLQVRDQLQAAQLAIVTNRIEAEATSRVQAASFNERLDSLKSALAIERERQQAETLRLTAERDRRDGEQQRSTRTILLVAAAFGGVGVLAMILSSFFQWRAVARLGEIATPRPSLPALADSGGLLAGAAAQSDETVTLSNQRLLSAIERMERRIFELEHTTSHSSPETVAEPILESDSEAPRRRSAPDEQTAQFNVLLGKGRALINNNRVQEAVACYDEILKVDANHPEALVKKGAALERLKQDQEALRCYDRAIKADRHMTLAYLCKGGVYNRLARFDEAVACYEQALQVEEDRK